MCLIEIQVPAELAQDGELTKILQLLDAGEFMELQGQQEAE